jgi:hypothetical protein
VLASKLCKRVYSYFRFNPDLKPALRSICRKKHPLEEDTLQEICDEVKTDYEIAKYLNIAGTDLRSTEESREDKKNNVPPVPKDRILPWKESLDDYMFYL